MLSNLNSERQKARLEIYNTIVLAVATLCAAWCAYQGNLWDAFKPFDWPTPINTPAFPNKS